MRRQRRADVSPQCLGVLARCASGGIRRQAGAELQRARAATDLIRLPKMPAACRADQVRDTRRRKASIAASLAPLPVPSASAHIADASIIAGCRGSPPTRRG